MKFYLIGFLMYLNFHSVFAADPVMEACGSAMDLAESNLRILLSKPAQGNVPKEWKTEKEIREASKRLLRVELRFPGCMRGDFGKSSWSQYNTVRNLFDELMGQSVESTIKSAKSDELKKLEACEAQLTTFESREPKVYNKLFRESKQIMNSDEMIKKESSVTVPK